MILFGITIAIQKESLMARQCGLTKLAPREGEVMRCIRIRPEDAEKLKTTLGLDCEIETGLYQVIEEVWRAYRPIVAARLGIEPNEVSNGMMM